MIKSSGSALKWSLPVTKLLTVDAGERRIGVDSLPSGPKVVAGTYGIMTKTPSPSIHYWPGQVVLRESVRSEGVEGIARIDYGCQPFPGR